MGEMGGCSPRSDELHVLQRRMHVVDSASAALSALSWKKTRCCDENMSALRHRSQKSGSAASGRQCFRHSGWAHAIRSCECGTPVCLCRFCSTGSYWIV